MQLRLGMSAVPVLQIKLPALVLLQGTDCTGGTHVPAEHAPGVVAPLARAAVEQN
jgi:hypothetical protein